VTALIAPSRHRPRYHYTAPRGWLNDPNGVGFHAGRYHLFYQFNPAAPRWGDIQWGHASSADLLTWRDEPVALVPSPGHDAGGCFSGSLALVDGVPTIYYTGYTPERQVQCVATGSDDLRHWTKQPQRTIVDPPEGVGATDFRDPYVFRHDGQWRMAVGASLRSERGQVLLYRSDDGVQWHHLGPAYTAPDLAHGVLWECPNLFPLGDRWVLTVSVWPNLGVLAYVGRFDGTNFVPESESVHDVDGGAFAHLAMRAPDGRTLQWSWLNEQRAQPAIDAEGWAGALSVPRELALDARHRLLQRPAAEVAALRRGPVPITATGERRGITHRFQGTCLDLEARFTMRDRLKCGLVLAASPGGEESTRVLFWPDARRLVVERGASSQDPGTRRQDLWALLVLDEGEPLDLRVLLDHSVLEVYANQRLCLSTRLYPTRADSLEGWAFADGDADVAVQAWTMGGVIDAASGR